MIHRSQSRRGISVKALCGAKLYEPGRLQTNVDSKVTCSACLAKLDATKKLKDSLLRHVNFYIENFLRQPPPPPPEEWNQRGPTFIDPTTGTVLPYDLRPIAPPYDGSARRRRYWKKVTEV